MWVEPECRAQVATWRAAQASGCSVARQRCRRLRSAPASSATSPARDPFIGGSASTTSSRSPGCGTTTRRSPMSAEGEERVGLVRRNRAPQHRRGVAAAAGRLRDFATVGDPNTNPYSKQHAGEPLNDYSMSQFVGPLPIDPVLGTDARQQAKTRLDFQQKLEAGLLGSAPLSPDAATALLDSSETQAATLLLNRAEQQLTQMGMSQAGAITVIKGLASLNDSVGTGVGQYGDSVEWVRAPPSARSAARSPQQEPRSSVGCSAASQAATSVVGSAASPTRTVTAARPPVPAVVAEREPGRSRLCGLSSRADTERSR